MASIGGVNVHAWTKNEVQPLGGSLELRTRPGVSGYDLIAMGGRSEPFEMESVSDYDTESDRHAAHASFNALRGYVVSLVDNDARTWSVAVLGINVVGKLDSPLAVGGLTSGKYELRLSWRLQAV
jgi:hypothetical protein